MIRPNFLSATNRLELEQCLRRHREEYGIARRANAILLLDKGKPCAEIAEFLYLDDDTIRGWPSCPSKDYCPAAADQAGTDNRNDTGTTGSDIGLFCKGGHGCNRAVITAVVPTMLVSPVARAAMWSWALRASSADVW